MNEDMYTEGPRRKDYSAGWRSNMPKVKPAPKLLSCHFCGNQWDSKNRLFVCPKCHTVYNPQKSPAIDFGGEVRVARLRENMSQGELAQKIGCAPNTIVAIEKGRTKFFSKHGKMLRERLRIWVENTKSPIDRRKEIDNMFNFNGKEERNG